ncbi:unnamed protein product [Fraxinus pennsylvanica]|uniref:Uncharacterized protein n=1 Tax=Fraxinus pennsylvanica TaxID=56036 RepID=A0AAD2DTL9_9LAMI|nr:unnamed protein product [Fraxinus pennsylvanica]
MSFPAAFVRIAGDGTSDMVDQAVSMAFGESRGNNYVRIQGGGIVTSNKENRNMLMIAEELLAQKNVESVLFSGKKLVEKTNIEKLEMICGELMKEDERRKKSIVPTVVFLACLTEVAPYSLELKRLQSQRGRVRVHKLPG